MYKFICMDVSFNLNSWQLIASEKIHFQLHMYIHCPAIWGVYQSWTQMHNLFVYLIALYNYKIAINNL